MAFDAMPGGDPRGPWCKACKEPIMHGQRARRVEYQDDPQDVNGLYHEPCSKPIIALTNVYTILSRPHS